MKELVIKYMSRFVVLTEEEKSVILNYIKVASYAKGTVLLKAGDISTDGIFILKGCARQYYLVDGEEKTTAFYTEQQSVSFCNNPFTPLPSSYYISCVEDTTVVTSFVDQEGLDIVQKNPRFETLCRMITESDLSNVNEAFATFLVSSPEERYLNLLQTRPELVNRVPQSQLASYLGMTAESLSRIRKRVTQKAKASKSKFVFTK